MLGNGLTADLEFSRPAITAGDRAVYQDPRISLQVGGRGLSQPIGAGLASARPAHAASQGNYQTRWLLRWAATGPGAVSAVSSSSVMNRLSSLGW
jgi:hypothetical protein